MPQPIRVVILGLSGIALAVPGAAAFTLLSLALGQPPSEATPAIGGAIGAVSGLWCGLLTPIFRFVVVNNKVSIGVLVLSVCQVAAAIIL